MTRIVSLPPPDGLLPDGAVVGGWWRDTEDGRLLCELCPRACKLNPGDRGFCFVRENRDGQMVLGTYGRSTGFCVDPIEKKPLNHFFPGTSVLSFGTAGCNLGCKFCQNWDISKSREVARLSERAGPDAIAAAASSLGCRSVAFTYNDPVIWAEYAIDVAAACRQRQVKTVAVTAGYITAAARKPFFDAMDAANVDLKAFTEDFYFSLTASHLQPVLDTLRYLKHESDVWIEITNLIIPDANDSDLELRKMCDWIVRELGVDVPVHFTAFHPDFRMQDRPRTPHQTLLRARQFAVEAGIQFAYVGNVLDEANQSTYCPACGDLLIQRNHYELGRYAIDEARCGNCRTPIPGRFDASGPGAWGRRRQAVQISEYGETAGRDSPPAAAGLAPIVAAGPSSAVGAPDPSTRSAPTPLERNSMTASHLASALRLTDPQRQAICLAARDAVLATVRREAVSWRDPTLAGAAATRVSGVFVTLKRQGRLRGCCGSLGQQLPLGDALLAAAVRTAGDDPRLPPVSLRELPYLHLDVSLLHSFEPLPSGADERLDAVDVGTHGLQIQQGDKSGLLLPVVPVENDWDRETFLRQVCRKAGLASTAWREPSARLLRFQAELLEGELDAGRPWASNELTRAPLLSRDELENLRRHCQANVQACAAGATPSYYLPGCTDGTVQGAALILTSPQRSEPLRLAQISLRPGMPMQATMLHLAEKAAQQLLQLQIDWRQTRVDVAILDQFAMHGLAQSPDLRGVDPATQALMIVERNKTGWAFQPNCSAGALLAEVAQLTRVRAPESSAVYSADVETTAADVSVTSAPFGVAGSAARPPALAGQFYPADPAELQVLVGKLIGERPSQRVACTAAMAPHAGLKYSGHIAAETLKRIEWPRTVIVLGPKHTPQGVDWAVAPHERWLLPGGELEGDTALARHLVERVEGLEFDAAAHAREHAIEVELPLIHRLAPATRVVGIALGGGDWPRARELGRALAEALQSLPEQPLLLISSDMNHFASDAATRQLDALALEALESGDPERLCDVVAQHQISMCGVFPAAIALEALRASGRPPRITRVAYGTSADVTGDAARVVGYAGVLME